VLLNIIDNEPELAKLMTDFASALDAMAAQSQPAPPFVPDTQQQPPPGRPPQTPRIGDADTAYSQPAATAPPEPDTAPLEAFMVNPLQNSALADLPEGDYKLNEQGNAMIMTIPRETWDVWSAALDTSGADNGSLGGFKGTYGDGGVLAVVVTNSPDGACLDACICLPEGAFPDVPNPSLKPRFDLVGDMQFDYPDGSKRFLRLVPSQ